MPLGLLIGLLASVVLYAVMRAIAARGEEIVAMPRGPQGDKHWGAVAEHCATCWRRSRPRLHVLH
jgi:hypothetical protein